MTIDEITLPDAQPDMKINAKMNIMHIIRDISQNPQLSRLWDDILKWPLYIVNRTI